MATVMKCDRCGKIYDCNEDSNRDYSRIAIGHYDFRYPDEFFGIDTWDLCPECIDAAYEFMGYEKCKENSGYVKKEEVKDEIESNESYTIERLKNRFLFKDKNGVVIFIITADGPITGEEACKKYLESLEEKEEEEKKVTYDTSKIIIGAIINAMEKYKNIDKNPRIIDIIHMVELSDDVRHRMDYETNSFVFKFDGDKYLRIPKFHTYNDLLKGDIGDVYEEK